MGKVADLYSRLRRKVSFVRNRAVILDSRMVARVIFLAGFFPQSLLVH